MIPVTQTRTGYGQGNCTEACVASVLEVPLSEVPDLYDGPEAIALDPDRQEPFRRLWAWLRRRDLFWLGLHFQTPQPLPFDLTWLGGTWLSPLLGVEHHLIGGTTAGGLGHMVVGRRGTPCHDTNPARPGIVGGEDLIFLVPLAWTEAWDLPDECRKANSAGFSLRSA